MVFPYLLQYLCPNVMGIGWGDGLREFMPGHPVNFHALRNVGGVLEMPNGLRIIFHDIMLRPRPDTSQGMRTRCRGEIEDWGTLKLAVTKEP